MSEERVRRRVTASGRVQGVFFRHSVRELARSHGVAGWVCNRSDGAVEAVLEGNLEDVRRLLSFFEAGPPAAEVERVEVNDEPLEGLRGFEIR